MTIDQIIRDAVISLFGKELADRLYSRRPDLVEAEAVAVGQATLIAACRSLQSRPLFGFG